MGYKVYAGTMKTCEGLTKFKPEDYKFPPTSEDGYVYSPDAAEWDKKILIWDGTTTALIIDPVLTQEMNEIETFAFTVPKSLLSPDERDESNPIYDKIEEWNTIIGIYEDDVLIWLGYVTATSLQFNLNYDVTVYQLAGSLQQKGVRINAKKYIMSNNKEGAFTYESIFQNAVEYGARDPFAFGGASHVNPELIIDRSKDGAVVDTAWNIIQSLILNEYGGFLYYDYVTNSEGKIFFIIYHLDETPDQTEQTIEFGVNMLDLQIEEDISTDLVNFVSGYNRWSETVTSGWWIFASTSTTDKYAVGEAKDEASIAKYGIHSREILDDTAKTRDAMNKVCEEALKQYKQFVEPTITVKAFDLADTGVATDHLGFLKKTRIISEPHNIDEWMVCTKAVLPLDKPDQKEFTYGRLPEKLTDQQAKNATQGSHHDLSIRGLIRAANG